MRILPPATLIIIGCLLGILGCRSSTQETQAPPLAIGGPTDEGSGATPTGEASTRDATPEAQPRATAGSLETVASRRKNAYQIYDVVVGADFHPSAGDFLDDLSKIRVLSKTTKGPYTVVKLASTYWFDKGSDDHQKAGMRHMVLMVKLDEALAIVDAYIFVLEWAEQPMTLYWMRDGAALRTLDIPALEKPSSAPSKLSFGDHLGVSDLHLVSTDGLSPPDWMNGVLDTLVLKGVGAKSGPCWLGPKPATALDRTGAPCPASPAK